VRSAGVADVRLFDRKEALLTDFHAVLDNALMGTRLYVAGPESFMGLVMRIARSSISTRMRFARRSAAHLPAACTAFTAGGYRKRQDEHRPVHRVRPLVDRSRPLLASPGRVHGVMVDAEAPGELPPIKEVFL